MNKKLRIALIGCGRVAKLHVKGWQDTKLPFEFPYLVDIKPELAQKIKDDAGLKDSKVITDYRQALADPEVDAVEICTYSDLHTEEIAAALEAGKHVLTEKPVGYSLEECRYLRWVRQKFPNPKVGVAYSLRYSPTNQALRRELLAGTIGTPLFACIAHNHASDPAQPHDPDHIHTDLGGRYIAGSEMSHATHPFDLARYLLGDVVDVFAMMGKGVFATFRHNSGVITHVIGSATVKGGLSAPQAILIQGTAGTLYTTYIAGFEGWEPESYRGYLIKDGKQTDITPKTHDTSHGDLARCHNFYNAVVNNEPLICDMLDAIRTTELLHAVRDSYEHEIRVPIHRRDQTG